MSLQLYLLLGLCLLGTSFGAADKLADFKNSQKYRVIPSNDAQVDFLVQLAQSTSKMLLSGVAGIGMITDIRVQPNKVSDLLAELKLNGMQYYLIEHETKWNEIN